MARLNCKLGSDGKAVITVQTDPVTTFTMDTDEIVRAIDALGQCRAQMDPPVPLEFDKTASVMSLTGAPWASGVDAFRRAATLAIRDPRYGWQHYSFYFPDVRLLVGALQRYIQMPGPPTQSAN